MKPSTAREKIESSKQAKPGFITILVSALFTQSLELNSKMENSWWAQAKNKKSSFSCGVAEKIIENEENGYSIKIVIIQR